MQQGKNGGTIAQVGTYFSKYYNIKHCDKTCVGRGCICIIKYNKIYYYISIQMFGSFLVFLIAQPYPCMYILTRHSTNRVSNKSLDSVEHPTIHPKHNRQESNRTGCLILVHTHVSKPNATLWDHSGKMCSFWTLQWATIGHSSFRDRIVTILFGISSIQ